MVYTFHNLFVLDLSITNDIVSSKIYDNRIILISQLLICHFLMEVFLPPTCGVYISQLIRFAYVIMLMA